MNRLVAMFFIATLPLLAQTNRGGIAGTVTDQSSSTVPNATVTITNIGTNEVRTAKTAGNGTYNVANLEPVSYQVKVSAAGFKTAVMNDVKVDTAATASVSITLQTGSIDTRITVEASATMIDTQSGTSSNTISEQQIQDAPLLNRSVLDLALSLPNVSGDAGSEDPVITTVTPCPGCNLTLGGGRPMSTNMMADGASNTGVSLGRTMVSFSPEVVQEFTVQTSAFSAEYGQTGGGVINVTTKSGSNQFTGTALWFNRNPDLAAAPWTNAAVNRPVPTLKYNQASIAAGGPLWIPKVYDGRNKTFWFGAFEPQYRRDHLDQYGLMPTDGMRGGDFSGLTYTNSGWLPNSVVAQFKNVPGATNAVAAAGGGDNTIYNQFNVVNGNQFQLATLPTGATSYAPFPGNVIPTSMLDSTAQKALPYLAKAGPYYLNSNGLISNIFSPRLLSQDEKRYTLRIDHNLSNNNHVYGRYSTTPIVKIQGTPVSPTNNGALYSWGTQAMIADTHTFSPTLINELRLNFTSGRFSNTIDPQWDPKTGANLNTAFGLPSITTGGLPSFNSLFPGSALGGGGSTATGFGGAGSTNVDDREQRYGITDIIYKTRGAMSFKIGVDMSRSLQNVTPLYGAFGGVYTFAATQTNSNNATSGTGGATFASFLLGVPSTSVVMRNVEVPYYYRWLAGAGFIQDDWKVKPNLTLNLGFRYNLALPRTEKYNNQGVFRTDLAQTVNLPTPLKLADGATVTSTQVVPFAFSGIGGNSKYMTPPQYRDFEPRFGFAWQPKFLMDHHMVVRGGYGLSHAPISGFTLLPQPDFGATASFSNTTPNSGTANPNYMMRLGSNPPLLAPVSPTAQVFGPQGAPSNGLSLANSLYYQQAFGGYAVSQDYHTPYVNNWNFTLSWQTSANTTIDIAYQGAMGIHLFMGPEDVNPKNSSVQSAELGQNISTTATIADPLGRLNPFTGKVLSVQNGTLGSPYLGYSSLNQWYDASGNSIRHAGYINMTHRAGHSLTVTANYTYGKSIDDASSAGGDKNVLTPIGGQVQGQVVYGGTRANDRSVSTYDQRHVIHANGRYDLPFGTGQKFGNKIWKPLDWLVGGWTVAGLTRISSGFPYIDYLPDSNQLGDQTHSARPNILTGVPLINPLFNINCPVGTGCQPYLNPQAFERPALGALGTAPRTLDGVRGPWQPFFDANLQKTFKLRESGRLRLQFRVDALNIFNHPVFAVYPNNAGGADFITAPSTATLSTSAYNTWAAANNQPVYSATAGTPGNVLYTNIINMVNAQKTASGALPANFYTVPLAANFFATPVNNFNITTLDGYKQYQLKQSYGTNFGTLYNSSSPRYIQLGVKLYF